MSLFDDALEHIRKADQEITFAVGSIEMASGPDVGLLNGYTGSQTVKELREAKKQIGKTLARMTALQPV